MEMTTGVFKNYIHVNENEAKKLLVGEEVGSGLGVTVPLPER